MLGASIAVQLKGGELVKIKTNEGHGIVKIVGQNVKNEK